MKLNRIFRSRVTPGVPPAVEPGVSVKAGMNVGTSVTLANSNADPGHGYALHRTPAATTAFTMIEIAIALGELGLRSWRSSEFLKRA